MPIDLVKIPQNVYIEDRIVGPLSLRQIIIIMLGGGFSYILYSLIAKTYGSVSLPVTALVSIPGLLAAAFAFVRINDISLFRIMLLMIEQMNKPSIRTWSPRRGIIINIRTSMHPQAIEQKSHVQQQETSRFQELGSFLDAALVPQSKTATPATKVANDSIQEEEEDDGFASGTMTDISTISAELPPIVFDFDESRLADRPISPIQKKQPKQPQPRTQDDDQPNIIRDLLPPTA